MEAYPQMIRELVLGAYEEGAQTVEIAEDLKVSLPAHKSERITQAVEDAGCNLVYLPPYSPDFNPIENMWSKVKASLRKTAARTFDAVVDAVAEALGAITLEDCDGYFEHCD